MTIEQVDKFIDQVKRKNIRLNTIHVLGGEPFLHPRLNDFISNLFYKLMVTGNVLRILIWTNGIIDFDGILKNCKQDSAINRAFDEGRIGVVVSPEGKEKTFMYVLWAPVDLGIKWSLCDVPRDCGILVNRYGYWPGSVCGQIALLFGMTQYARYDFPVRHRSAWPRLKNDICKYCVVGCKKLINIREGYVTPSYRMAISKWMKGIFLVPRKF